jgi:hypothetical protein
MRRGDAGALLEQLARKVPDAARARRGVVERLGAALRERHDIGDRIDRQQFVGDERHRLCRHHADADEILERIQTI